MLEQPLLVEERLEKQFSQAEVPREWEVESRREAEVEKRKWMIRGEAEPAGEERYRGWWLSGMKEKGSAN